jgi:hypothetical protein
MNGPRSKTPGRYLPLIDDFNRDTLTTVYQSQKSADRNRDPGPLVTVSKTGANPHEYRDVTVVTVKNAEHGDGGLKVDDRTLDEALADPTFLAALAAEVIELEEVA